MTRLLPARFLPPRAVAVALTGVVLIGGGLAGCGGAGSNGIAKLSADKALAKVKHDVALVKTVHAKGTIDENGQKLGIDVHLSRTSGIGILSLGNGQLQVRLVSGTAYIRGDATAYTAFGASPTQVQQVAGKWLSSKAGTGELAAFSGFLELGKLFSSMLTPNGAVSRGKTTTVDGQPAYALVDGSNQGTLYIAETGRALPLRIAKSGTGGGQVDFSDYDQPVSVTAPAGAIDISQLGQ